MAVEEIDHKSLDKGVRDDVDIDQVEIQAEAPVAISSLRVIDPAEERKLVRKFDVRILPVLAIMYLFNALDKSNLGNAKTAPDRDGGSRGLPYDLNFASGQYNTILSIFFVPYVLTAPVLGIIGKKYGPSRVLAVMMFCFGSLTLLTISARNFSSILAIRWFLGMSESAFFPLVIYYQTTFYRRGELARRLAIFYAGQSIASAFSGLLAYGTFRIHGTEDAHSAGNNGGLPFSWSYLFLIEGCCTVTFSVFAFFYLPLSAAQSRFLSESERSLAFDRIQLDSSAVVGEKFSIRKAASIFKEPTSWVILAIEMCLGVPIQSVTLFLPPIVARLGFSSVKTNLYTVAPNVTGAIMLLVLAFSSDFTRWRWPFVAAGFAFTFIGFIVYASLDDVTGSQRHVAYFATFLMTWGTGAPSVLLDVWYSNNIANESRRLLLTSIAVPVANVMGLVSSNIFRQQDAPAYLPALITTASFGATGCLLTCALGVWMMYDNKRRDRKIGMKVDPRSVPTHLLSDGPSSADFRWCY